MLFVIIAMMLVLPLWRPRLKSSSTDHTLHNPSRSLHKDAPVSREPFTTYTIRFISCVTFEENGTQHAPTIAQFRVLGILSVSHSIFHPNH